MGGSYSLAKSISFDAVFQYLPLALKGAKGCAGISSHITAALPTSSRLAALGFIHDLSSVIL